MEKRIFWSVFLALLMASGVVTLLFAFGVVGVATVAQHQANVAVQDFQRQVDEVAAQERVRQAAAAERARIESARYDLADNQRCVGGAVVQVGGSSYTQVGSISYPIHCSGRRADKPLR